MRRHTLKGHYATRRVWLDGEELFPYQSQSVYNHSPDGFNWGYGGSGPAQLALAIMLALTNSPSDYQQFKWDVIAQLPEADFEIRFWKEGNRWRWCPHSFT